MRYQGILQRLSASEQLWRARDVYPYLSSGLILFGDTNSGLYALRDRLLAVELDSLSFNTAAYFTQEGDHLTTMVIRSSGTGSAPGLWFYY